MPKSDIQPAEAGYEQVKARALRLLTARARSCSELRSRLIAVGYPPEVVDQVVLRLEEVNLLDDASFAREFVAAALGRGLAEQRILRELGQHGVDRAVADESIRAICGAGAEDRLLESAHKKARSLRGLPDDVARRRLSGFLFQRGYGPDEVNEACRRVLGPQAALSESD